MLQQSSRRIQESLGIDVTANDLELREKKSNTDGKIVGICYGMHPFTICIKLIREAQTGTEIVHD
jgi:hypothetical protein